MAQLLLKLRTWWETADRTQKVVTIFGSALLAIILIATVMISGRPHYQVLYSDLSPADQGMVMSELTKLGIDAKNDRTGQVTVPEDKIADAQAKLALAGKSPATGHIGMEGLKDISAVTPPSIMDKRILTMQQDQLASAIEKIDGVTSASVIISPKKDSPFVENVDPAKVSITLQEKGTVGQEQVRAIKSMAQTSIEGLDGKNISIVSTTQGLLFDGEQDMGPGGVSNQRRQQERQEAQAYERNLQAKLAAVLGPDNVIVSVPVIEMNFDQADEKKIEHPISESPISVESVKEAMKNGKNSSTTNASGAASNTSTSAPATPDTDSQNQTYDTEHTSKQFINDEKVTHTTKAQGGLTKMSISVMVNDKITDIKPVQDVVAAWIAPYQSDPKTAANFNATVTKIPFDTTLKTEAAKAITAQSSAGKMQQILSLLPIGALLFVGMMVVKAIGKTAKSSMVVVGANGAGMQVLTGGQAASLGTGAAALPQGAMVDADGNPTEHALSLVEQSNAQNHDPNVVYTDEAEIVEIGNIPSKMHIPLEQLRKLSKDRPDTVALLLKSWILEER